MSLIKRLYLFLFICIATFQYSLPMESSRTNYAKAKDNLRKFIVNLNNNCKSNDNLEDEIRNVIYNLKLEEDKKNLRPEDFIFDDGENILTLFAKTCCKKDCKSCAGNFCDLVTYFIANSQENLLLKILALHNKNEETFFSVAIKNRLLGLLPLLIDLNGFLPALNLKDTILPKDKVLFRKDEALFCDFLSKKICTYGIQHYTKSFRPIIYGNASNISGGSGVAKFIDFALSYNLLGKGKKLLAFVKTCLSDARCQKDINCWHSQYKKLIKSYKKYKMKKKMLQLRRKQKFCDCKIMVNNK